MWNRKIVFFTLLLICAAIGNSFAQSNVYKLHALFIYNFTKHFQWPTVGETFTIGVFGSESALKEIRANLIDKKYSGKEIKVINVAGIGDANSCQIVYTPKSTKAKVLSLFESASKQNILFVSEDDLVPDGFPVSFIIQGEKLTFKISKKNLDPTGLKVSSALLSLAEVVD
ncbi:MAG: YfiR family protein [Cyclobacteriaceae bacterium]|nr:YfiR family protein [Cyclobacteriaceae bacterium]